MLLQKFKQHLKTDFNLSSVNCHLILAVSGGVDSVVMVDLFANAGFDFTIAHCNFKLRNEESERDENFVRSLENKYNKKVLVKQFNTAAYADEYKLSIQEAARNLRYDWFIEVRESIVNKPNDKSVIGHQLYLICTAHHANDNIETVLMNIFRGTGFSGLHGIPAKQNNIIRPLLFATREQIVAYAKDNNLDWVEDSSNAKDDYTRNYFRHQLIPSLQNIFPKVEENLLANIERWKDAEKLYTESISSYRKKIITVVGNELHMPVLLLQKQKAVTTVLYEIVKDFGFTAHQLTDIISLLTAGNSKYVASATHRIIRNRKWLVITPAKTAEAANILIEEGNTEIAFDNGKIQVDRWQMTDDRRPINDSTNQLINLDATSITFPLVLRKWKQGDYFYPLGMNKKKKLSRFFIDQKLSITDKEKVWVIESDQKILWVIGYRIDNRFKLQPNTANVLQLSFKS